MLLLFETLCGGSVNVLVQVIYNFQFQAFVWLPTEHLFNEQKQRDASICMFPVNTYERIV